MDTAFHLDERSRANFLRLIMQSFGCNYICLWSYLPPPSNCLVFFDGVYDEENQPSSSSGSLARRLFDEYRLSMFNVVETECVPGFAFRNCFPYVELQEMDIQRLASIDIQRQFYQEARIKTAVFMGCKSGEIELGFSNVSQLSIQRELLRTWLPEAFSRQLSPHTEVPSRTSTHDQQNPLSSSSSSLRSLSTMDSPEYSSLLFSIPTTTTTSHINIPQVLFPQPPNSLEPINISSEPIIPTINTFSTSTSPHQQAIQAFSRIRNTQFPPPEIEEAAMTRAILAVLSSPSSSSAHQPPQETNPPSSSTTPHLLTPKISAFKTYNTSALVPRTQIGANLRKQTMLKRSFSFLKSLSLMRTREGIQATRPTTSQLHHMISERKRREKLNDSFLTLKSLLPPGTKKDKASVLTTAREYLTSLKAQVAELSRKNQQLEAMLLPAAKLEANEEEAAAAAGSSIDQRISLKLTRVRSESTPDDQDQQIIDLQVVLRSAECRTEDMIIRILEFLKQVENVSLMSMEANTWISESNSNVNRVILRLRVDQGTEWDEAAFQEAVRRLLLTWL